MSEPITFKRHLRMNTPDKVDFFDQTTQGVLSQPLDRPEGKLKVTGTKSLDKVYYRHSGFPGGLTSTSYTELMAKDPEKAVEKAVRGMLPKTKLGRAQIAKLKVYRGAEHPHAAQQPKPFEITQVAQ